MNKTGSSWEPPQRTLKMARYPLQSVQDRRSSPCAQETKPVKLLESYRHRTVALWARSMKPSWPHRQSLTPGEKRSKPVHLVHHKVPRFPCAHCWSWKALPKQRIRMSPFATLIDAAKAFNIVNNIVFSVHWRTLIWDSTSTKCTRKPPQRNKRNRSIPSPVYWPALLLWRSAKSL